jgi:predicted CXXCH cytochrome family protein
MSIKEIFHHESYTFKGGSSMKKTSLIVVLVAVSLLFLASVAMAAPGNYGFNVTTSEKYEGNLTGSYQDGVGNVYSPGYQFLNPRAANLANKHNLVNANRTGENNVPYFTGTEEEVFFNTYQRNVSGQLVHTDFQLNTNSCASCHMTHTAQSRKLLFRNGVYTTCTACHDGTLGYLNVFAAPTAENPYGGSKTAGTFGADMGRNASVHLANGAVKLAAAPGGNRANVAHASDNDGLAAGARASSTWASDFTCASCHGPHGSYSVRLLHSNPNNIAIRMREGGTMANSGGLWQADYALVGADHAEYEKKFTATGWNVNNPWFYGYPGGATNGTGALAGRWSRFTTRVYAPTLYNPNTVGGPMAAIDGTKIFNTMMSINYGKAYAYFKDGEQVDAFLDYILAAFPTANGGVKYTSLNAFLAAHPLKVDIGGVVKVTASYNYEDNAENRYKSDFINTTSYSGNVIQATGNQVNNAPYNLFCASCHVDYLSVSASGQGDGVGVYSKAHRHTINRGATSGGTMQVKGAGNTLLCVSCHFAHGADSSFMSLANAQLVDAHPDFKDSNDVNPSSALKRYVNMSVCWSCHANSSAASLKNSQWYWDGYDKDNRGSW